MLNSLMLSSTRHFSRKGANSSISVNYQVCDFYSRFRNSSAIDTSLKIFSCVSGSFSSRSRTFGDYCFTAFISAVSWMLMNLGLGVLLSC